MYNLRSHLVRWLVLLLCVLLCAPFPVLAQGRIYYVDSAGSDATGDGSQARPWCTVRYAASQVAAGDTVLINSGTYEGGIVVETSGRADAPITFRGNGPGAVVEGSGGERDAFFVTGADYIMVENLTIRHANRAGIRISWSDHVTVRACTLADNETWGVFTDFSDYTLIENCESYGAGREHGIYISNSSDYPTIRGNRLHHNYACGLHMNGDASMGGDGLISGALVEQNIIYANGQGGGSAINMDGVTGSVVRNNLLYDNHAGGISLYQIDGAACSRDNGVWNNTVVMSSSGRWAVSIPGNGCTGNKLFNNILYNYHGYRGSILVATPHVAGFESDYNVVMNRFAADGEGDMRLTLAEWQALGYDVHSRIATPDEFFANPTAGDYHLLSGCPAIDAGLSLADVPTDLEGNLRPWGLGHDIGAYEWRPRLANLKLPLLLKHRR